MRKVYSLLFILLLGSFGVLAVHAATVPELQTQITDRNNQIQALQAEIKKYEAQLAATQAQSSSLKGDINKIDLTRAKLTKQIALTKQKVSAAIAAISNITAEINQKGVQINTNNEVLAESFRDLNDADQVSLIEVALSSDQLSDVLSQTETYSNLNKKITDETHSLTVAKTELESKKVEQISTKQTLASFQSQLGDQKSLADQTLQSKNTLLAQTKAQESTYQKLVADRKAKMQAVEAEIHSIESQLHITINPNSIPTSGAVFHWPLDSVTITQYFGSTPFATANPQGYGGLGHNGIDLRASVGTPVHAALSGTVTGTGNTDEACVGASYGKWVLIDHHNGLSTLYGHNSLIKVTEGQEVSTGDLIAYSGATGYVTGPHVHFSVFATAGVHVGPLQSKVPGCGIYKMPLASYSAYLNPLSYLPKI